MLIDSFYEGRVPTSRMRGVSRLNNRLSFYSYESRKLRYFRNRSLPLLRLASPNSSSALYKQCRELETTLIEYTFTQRK